MKIIFDHLAIVDSDEHGHYILFKADTKETFTPLQIFDKRHRTLAEMQLERWKLAGHPTAKIVEVAIVAKVKE